MGEKEKGEERQGGQRRKEREVRGRKSSFFTLSNLSSDFRNLSSLRPSVFDAVLQVFAYWI